MVRRAVCQPRIDCGVPLSLNNTKFTRAALRAALALVLVTTLATFLVFCPGASTFAQADMQRETLKFVTATGTHDFKIEVANTMQEKSRGLMFRRNMDDDAGMLFPYEPAQEITMWMKNTYISLDMVFIRADGIVHRIATATEPFSEAVIASKGDARAVLELKAGIAAKIGLKTGDRVLHPLFGTSGRW